MKQFKERTKGGEEVYLKDLSMSVTPCFSDLQIEDFSKNLSKNLW